MPQRCESPAPPSWARSRSRSSTRMRRASWSAFVESSKGSGRARRVGGGGLAVWQLSAQSVIFKTTHRRTVMQENQHPRRREFIGQLGAIAMAATLPPAVGQLESARRHQSAPAWDMSWVDKVSAATYRVAIDTTKIEGDGLYTALDILDTFHEVYGGGSEQTRVVVVLRHYAAAMAQSDAMWEKYGIGAERNVTDPETKAPAKRNPFLRAGPSA